MMKNVIIERLEEDDDDASLISSLHSRPAPSLPFFYRLPTIVNDGRCSSPTANELAASNCAQNGQYTRPVQNNLTSVLESRASSRLPPISAPPTDSAPHTANFSGPFPAPVDSDRSLKWTVYSDSFKWSHTASSGPFPLTIPSMGSIRRPPPVTVLMPYRLHSQEKRTTIVKFKPFNEIEKETWLSADPSHGFIRIYEIGIKDSSKRSVVVPCTLDTNCRQIAEKLFIFEHELHVTLNGDTVRRLSPLDKPLRIQNNYLATIGVTEPRRQREAGDSLDLCYLIKFTAGRPMIGDEFGRSTLSCYCHVRKGRVFHQWTKRLCVLNGARLLVYPNLDRCGTPDIIALSRAKVEDVHLRSRGRCIKITVAAPRRPVQAFYIAFDSVGSAKVPPISDLSNLQLEHLPEQVFTVGSERLLTQLNLRRNCLKRRPPNEGSFTVGWLEDLPRLESLRSLNLADNDLGSCPSALFQLHALTELVLSGNKLNDLPAGIGKLRNLQLLNLQNNWLSRLPLELAECVSLTSLDLSFNHFDAVPDVLCQLPVLDHWLLNGNDIELFVDEELIKAAPCIRKIELRRCRLVQNAINTIPVGLLPMLTHLDIRDNSCITSLDLKSLPSLQVLYCQRCNLYELQLNGSALTSLYASRNNLRNVLIMPVPKQLKIFDVSYNNLSQLPDWLTELGKIEKIIASYNRLVSLPQRMFTSVSSLKTLILHHNSITDLPDQVENCFIECLELHHNKLTRLPDEFLASAHKLRMLNLSENQLDELPPLNPFLDLNKVQQLYLACNRLTDSAISIISAYRRLRILDLAYNNIENVDDSCIERLHLLESLNLSGNRLHCLPSSLAVAPNLAVLRVHSNRLTSLLDFSKSPCLKVLDCGSNQLEDVDVRHLMASQLKHLDVSCNARLRLDTSAFQQFQSGRSVSLVDMKRESRSESATSTPKAAPTGYPQAKPLWRAGFSETSGERNKLCVSQIRCPVWNAKGYVHSKTGFGNVLSRTLVGDASARIEFGDGPSRIPIGDAPSRVDFGDASSRTVPGDVPSKTTQEDFAPRTGALFAIIDGGLNNELPQHLASRLSDILLAERRRECTAQEFMKYALLNAHQGLQTSGQKMGASCTLCYIEETGTSKLESGLDLPSYTLHMANVGHTEAVICRKGKPVTLTKSHLVEDASPDEMERVRKAGAIVTEENEVNGITPCSRLLGCNFLYPAVIPCPHVMSLALQVNDEFMLIASRGLWEVMSQTEAVKRIRKITNPILAAKHLQDVAQSYGYKENLSILVVRFFFSTSPCDSDKSTNQSSPMAPLPLIGKRHAFGPAMSAMNVADSDDYSLTSDEDVKSEPRDTKQIRDPPNYYFEYKKQLKQLTMDTGSSDECSVIDGPESLYSVATLIHGGMENDQTKADFCRNGRQYFDDGYQSSENSGKLRMVSIAGRSHNPDYTSMVPSTKYGVPTSGRGNLDGGQEHSNTVSPNSANSSCSSGLGKSSTSSPDNPPICIHPTEETIPRWRMDDQEVLHEAKQRFQQARQLILTKLSNGADEVHTRPQPHVIRTPIQPDNMPSKTKGPIGFQDSRIQIQSNTPDGSTRNSCCCHKGEVVDVAVCTEDFACMQTLGAKEPKRRPIYQHNDDGQLFDEVINGDQESSWHNYLAPAYSDDQLQSYGRRGRPYEEDHPSVQSPWSHVYPESAGRSGNLKTTVMKRHRDVDDSIHDPDFSAVTKGT